MKRRSGSAATCMDVALGRAFLFSLTWIEIDEVYSHDDFYDTDHRYGRRQKQIRVEPNTISLREFGVLIYFYPSPLILISFKNE